MIGKTIGILGGGQLGRMIILEGKKMGLRFLTLDPVPDCPGAQVSDEHITATYDDVEAAMKLAEKSDLVVYEFENIDSSIVQAIEKVTPVPQGSRLLEICQHRLKEKNTLNAAGIPVAPFVSVMNRSELIKGIEKLDYPVVLKTITGGYDGKGQWMLRTKKDVDALTEEIFSGNQTYVLEKFIPFDMEISVVVARNRHGEVAAFEPTVNLHRKHILFLSMASASISPEVKVNTIQLAKQVAETLQVVGLIAVEMFVQNGKLLVNELAPRPHNSGHYTYDACLTSQFAQFLRAVLGLPLGSVQQVSPAIMVNILGEQIEAFCKRYASLPGNVKAHWYGKKESKIGRKMGHVTILGEPEKAIRWLETSGIWEPLSDLELHKLRLTKCVERRSI